MSQLTSQIPFMASLWIRSGYDVKVEVSAQTYQVGAHIKALIKAVLIASLKTLENFFSFQESLMGSVLECFLPSYCIDLCYLPNALVSHQLKYSHPSSEVAGLSHTLVKFSFLPWQGK